MFQTVLNILKDAFSRWFKLRTKPKVIQLPITSKCNSRCVTCNVWNYKGNVDIDPGALQVALQDPFFSEVKAVGINGGELTLVKNIEAVFEAITVLPKLQYVHVISNGLLPDRLLPLLKMGKSFFNAHQISFNFTLSVDGVGKVHELVRGIPNAFVRTKRILDEIAENKNMYCDSMTVGTTISKYNIPYIKETEAFLNGYDFRTEFHLAVPIKRIHTFDSAPYSVLTDERAKNLAIEFFYARFLATKNKFEKFRSFASYYYLKNNGRGRLSQCAYLYRDVTVDESLNIYLCATASDAIGNLTETNASTLEARGGMKAMQKQTSQYCDTCIHYVGTLSLEGYFIALWGYFYYYVFSWKLKYKFLTVWQRLRL